MDPVPFPKRSAVEGSRDTDPVPGPHELIQGLDFPCIRVTEQAVEV
jgi:hypothetical protein